MIFIQEQEELEVHKVVQSNQNEERDRTKKPSQIN